MADFQLTSTVTLTIRLPFTGVVSIGFALNPDQFGVTGKVSINSIVPIYLDLYNRLLQMMGQDPAYSEATLGALQNLSGGLGHLFAGATIDIGAQQGTIENLNGVQVELSVSPGVWGTTFSASPDVNGQWSSGLGASVTLGPQIGVAAGPAYQFGVVLFDRQDLARGLGEARAKGLFSNGVNFSGGFYRCFTADTPILMADGSNKPIRQISVGDLVAAFDLTGPNDGLSLPKTLST